MKKNIQRRNFLKTALRGCLGGGLAASGVVLASRRSPVQEDCNDPKHICPRCGKNATCGLPHAMNYRSHQARRSRTNNPVVS